MNFRNPQETKETKSCPTQFELEAVVATAKGPHGSSSCFLSLCFWIPAFREEPQDLPSLLLPWLFMQALEETRKHQSFFPTEFRFRVVAVDLLLLNVSLEFCRSISDPDACVQVPSSLGGWIWLDGPWLFVQATGDKKTSEFPTEFRFLGLWQ